MPTSSLVSIADLQTEIREMLPSLCPAQAKVIGEMAYAILMIDGCGMTRICSFMKELLGKPSETLRQRYREVYYEKEAKAGVKKGGKKRQEIEVEQCFPDLLRGVIRNWEGEKTLVLALDASALGERFTILSISVVYRGCGIPVAWYLMRGGEKGSWRPHWERLLQSLAGGLPVDWLVLVMADRGLYADWLFRAIQANGWHPYLRVKQDVSFRGREEGTFTSIGSRVKRTGRGWEGEGEWSENGERMSGTALVRWEKGYEEAICVVTDLRPGQSKAAWYQMRFWIEDEYKDRKRGWFHWEQTKMTKPERASRLWLVLAIVLQKAILLGGGVEAKEQEAASVKKRRKGGPKRRRGRPAQPKGRPRGREQSVLMRGMMALRAAEVTGKRPLPAGYGKAEPLPSRLYPVTRKAKSHQLKKKRKEEKKRQRKSKQVGERREERVQKRAARQVQAETQRRERAQKRAIRQAEAKSGGKTRIVTTPTRDAGNEKTFALREREVLLQDSQTSQCSEVGKGGCHQKRKEEGPLLRLRQGRLQSPERPKQQKAECKSSVQIKTEPMTAEKVVRAVPLLRLNRGMLQPPQRPVGKEIHLVMGHGSAQQAGP